MSIKIGIDLREVGTEVNPVGSFVLVLMFEGKRKELIIVGVDVNKEWILSNGKGSEHTATGT